MREGQIIAAESPDEIRRRTGKHDLEDAFIELASDRRA
jgi:ABC-type Na+ transport system ATPase subunit NatA